MNVIVGDDTGLLKQVGLKKGAGIKRYGSQTRERSIGPMCYSGAGGTIVAQESQVAVGLASGIVENWDIDAAQLTATFSNLGIDSTNVNDCLVGIASLDQATGHRRLLTCTRSGNVVVTPWDAAAGENGEREEKDGGKAPQSGANKKQKQSNDKLEALKETAARVTFKVGAHINKLRLEPVNAAVFGTVGKDTTLNIWDLETQVSVFSGKIQKPDYLGNRPPMVDNDFQFVRTSPTVYVTGTADHRVRMYDSRVHRRAVQDWVVSDYAVTSLEVLRDGTGIVFGDGVGKLAQLDIRTGRHVQGYKGIGGGVKSTQIHETMPLLASCGLDRFLRVHHLTTGKLLQKKYLKQKLNGLLFSRIVPRKKDAKKQGEEESDEKEAASADETQDASDADEDNDEEIEEEKGEGRRVWQELEDLTSKKMEKEATLSRKRKPANGGDVSATGVDRKKKK